MGELSEKAAATRGAKRKGLVADISADVVPASHQGRELLVFNPYKATIAEVFGWIDLLELSKSEHRIFT